MVRLRVAVGVLYDEQGKVLVGQRTVRDRYFRQWEFPGGKLEPNETAEQALRRELHEELGISVERFEPLIEMAHQYPDRHVELHVYVVTRFSGMPIGRESQALQWVAPAQLSKIDLLSGNQPIVEAIQNRPI